MKSSFILFSFIALSLISKGHAKSLTKRVAYVDMGSGIGTGYFIKAKNPTCGDEAKERSYFITAGHVAFKIQSPTQIIAKKNTLDFVTNSSAGNPLEIFKGLAPMAAGMGAAYSGFFTLNQVVTGMNVMSYLQSGSEVLGYLHYDLSGNKFDMEFTNSNDKKTVGIFKRLASMKPSFGTYFRVGLKHFDITSCHDTIKLDLTDKTKERTDVEYFRPAEKMPEKGDKLQSLGFPGSKGRFHAKNCTYEGIQYVGGVKGANTESVLHSMKCPDVFFPQGLSGGPVLNDKGEVVGTVTRGGVFWKSESPVRTAGMAIDEFELRDIEMNEHESIRKKSDFETVILFAELAQENINCDGEVQLGYRGQRSFITADDKKLEGVFDKNGCISLAR